MAAMKAAHSKEAANQASGHRKRSRVVRFPEVAGKTLEFVELWLEDDDESYIELRFPDQTALVFPVRPYPGVKVRTRIWQVEGWGLEGNRVIARDRMIGERAPCRLLRFD